MASTQQLLLGEGAGGAEKNYIEDVFSTYLYTGNGTSQSIVNNIDLSTKGGFVWIKDRTSAYDHMLFDTARGANYTLRSNTADAQQNQPDRLSTFNTNGFSIGNGNAYTNGSGDNYVSWTFRKQPKFFDVVTYTGNGTSGRTVAHSLGSTPGCIIVKRTSGDPIEWAVYHRSLDATSPQNYYLRLNTTAARALQSGNWNDTAPTSTVFTLGDSGAVNTNGETYVAYLFAHDAGGFGLTGTDNVISCGSYTGTGAAGNTISLGYEPQFLLIKNASNAAGWYMYDDMRGFFAPTKSASDLSPNTSAAEVPNGSGLYKNATGFSINTTGSYANASGDTYIYIAIRRGPMKVPTDATKVFKPLARAGTSAAAVITGVGFPPDTALIKPKDTGTSNVDRSFNFFDKLRKPGYRLSAAFTDAEDTSINFITSFDQDGMTLPSTGYTATNGSSYNYINYFFRRAPSFFDEVCYTGTGSARTVTHNLGVTPELMVFKARSSAQQWGVYQSSYGPAEKLLLLNDANGLYGPFGGIWNGGPTSTTFGLPASGFSLNDNGVTYVAYLFATCAGVSKVGSYTGTGTTKQVDCGFAAGARFVLIKKTSGTGSWYIWDSSRGITSGNDPYLLLNSTAAEVTSTDYIDTYAAGFEISSTAPSEINENGGSFIFLAIA